MLSQVTGVLWRTFQRARAVAILAVSK